MKLTGLFTTTLAITASSEAMVEFAWVCARTMFSFTACALSGVPSVNFRPGRSVNVTLLPSEPDFHDEARPGFTFPAGSRLVIEAYTRPRTCTSQPAVEVTGSQEVGSSHSQFSVPVAPTVADGELPAVPELPPQAVASSDSANTTAGRTRVVRRTRRRRTGMTGS